MQKAEAKADSEASGGLMQKAEAKADSDAAEGVVWIGGG